MAAEFPAQQPGLNYLTEGGQETEIMYKYGFELPHFAMFPLLDDPRAMSELRAMYGRYLDTAARHSFGVVVGGLDYRASPDWGSLLGYSRESLAEMQLRAIDFLREVAQPYEGQVSAIMYAGIIGPRGDAYETNPTITTDEAEDYTQRAAGDAGPRRRRPGRGDDVQLGAGDHRIVPCRVTRGASAMCVLHARQQHQPTGIRSVAQGRDRDHRCAGRG